MSITVEDVTEYEKSVFDLNSAKKKELELRNKIINNYEFSEHEGVQHRSIGDGCLDYDISITLKMNRVLNQEIVEDLWGSLSGDERDSVEFKPKLVMNNYKQLVLNGGVNGLSKAIVEKQGQATLKVKLTEIL